MKKITLTIVFIFHGVSFLYAQVTNYGTGSGTQGTNNAFFGYFSGHSADAFSYHNAFFGANSGKQITQGYHNTGLGSHVLFSLTTGSGNTAVGTEALYSVTIGGQNTATGYKALYANTGYYNSAFGYLALGKNTSGSHNTAVGDNALRNNTIGRYNSAVGFQALIGNTTGYYNTACGYDALQLNSSGEGNTAHGYQALNYNQTGYHNTALGYRALFSTTTSGNTSIGAESLLNNTDGNRNTATGYRALYANTIGNYNTSIGNEAMYSNVSGSFNAATGYYALYANTTGTHNSASGFRALDSNTTGGYNTAKGTFALDDVTTGSYNSALGYNAGPTAGDLYNTTAIGYLAVPTASNQVRVGNTLVTSIGGQVSWTTFSDGRFKKDIKEDVSGLDFIAQLRPVSYTIDRSEINKFLHITDSTTEAAGARIKLNRHTGFIAQEVEALVKKSGYVFDGVDTPENENDHYGIRYAEFVVPLVKAVQELTAKLQSQEEKIELLLSQLDAKNNLEKSDGDLGKTILFQNNPNPFGSETEIKMIISERVKSANVTIYNMEGRQLKNFHINNRGDVAIRISGNEFPAGVYLYTLIADGQVLNTKRMILTDGR